MATDIHPSQGVKAMPNASQIGGSTIFTHGADMNTAPVPNRIGDLCLNYAMGKLYVATGVSATSDWAVVTQT